MKSLGLSRYALAMGAAAALLAGCGEAQPAAHKGVGRGVRINGCVMGTKATIDTPFNVKGAWLSILCGILLAHFYNFRSGLHHCMSWDWAFGKRRRDSFISSSADDFVSYDRGGGSFVRSRWLRYKTYELPPDSNGRRIYSYRNDDRTSRVRHDHADAAGLLAPLKAHFATPPPAHPALTKQIGTIGALM